MKRMSITIEVGYEAIRRKIMGRARKSGGKLTVEVTNPDIPLIKGTKQVQLYFINFEEYLTLEEVNFKTKAMGCRPAMYWERHAALGLYYESPFPIPSPIYFLGSHEEILGDQNEAVLSYPFLYQMNDQQDLLGANDYDFEHPFLPTDWFAVVPA
jgi:hypothetical protein